MAKPAHNINGGPSSKPQNRPSPMSHSFSDGSMHHYNTQSNKSSPQRSGLFDTHGFSYIRFADENDPPLLPPLSPRGRPIARTPSPVKQLEDIREEVSISPKPQTPPKRSRSPVKQLFGEKGWLGRSTSMKELPSEEFRKTGLKIWGGKLKQKMLAKVRPLPAPYPIQPPIATSQLTNSNPHRQKTSPKCSPPPSPCTPPPPNRRNSAKKPNSPSPSNPRSNASSTPKSSS